MKAKELIEKLQSEQDFLDADVYLLIDDGNDTMYKPLKDVTFIGEQKCPSGDGENAPKMIDLSFSEE